MPPLAQFFIDWAGLLIIGSVAVAAFGIVSKMITPSRQ